MLAHEQQDQQLITKVFLKRREVWDQTASVFDSIPDTIGQICQIVPQAAAGAWKQMVSFLSHTGCALLLRGPNRCRVFNLLVIEFPRFLHLHSRLHLVRYGDWVVDNEDGLPQPTASTQTGT
mmetsp:Transcript_27346/g.63069  ORF Transcript_27346/g.63069 Transcript_27346/m.63069 type:complete len:122 (+) Transcript_27346:1524-1889(+)